jgi:hypothetical protein
VGTGGPGGTTRTVLSVFLTVEQKPRTPGSSRTGGRPSYHSLGVPIDSAIILVLAKPVSVTAVTEWSDGCRLGLCVIGRARPLHYWQLPTLPPKPEPGSRTAPSFSALS